MNNTSGNRSLRSSSRKPPLPGGGADDPASSGTVKTTNALNAKNITISTTLKSDQQQLENVVHFPSSTTTPSSSVSFKGLPLSATSTITLSPTRNLHHLKWEKKLYIKQDFPDNYVDSASFLKEMKKNANVKPLRYWQVVGQTCRVSQQISVVVIFIGLYFHLAGLDDNATYSSDGGTGSVEDAGNIIIYVWGRNGLFICLGLFLLHHSLLLSSTSTSNSSQKKDTSRKKLQKAKGPSSPSTKYTPTSTTPPAIQPVNHIPNIGSTLISAFLFSAVLIFMTPILKNLTSDISTDSIWALTILMLLANLLFHSYDSNPDISHNIRFPDSISINAAMFASVLLASRLDTNEKVGALMLSAVVLFALLPIFRRGIRAYAAAAVYSAQKKDSKDEQEAEDEGDLTSKPADEDKRNPVNLPYSSGFYDGLMAIILTTISLLLFQDISYTFMIVTLLFNLAITFACPYLLVGLQKYKSEIRGPWDEASVEL